MTMENSSEKDRTLGLTLTILGLFLGVITWCMGRVTADVSRVDGRMDNTEIRAAAIQRDVEQRLARIEAKLDRLMERLPVDSGARR
ncbi:MAG: hypothetical protein HY320_08945 [Armatimonadetes bacterium]|nr:hypothetical protein [Armatimonadota bacterium]